MAVLSQVYATLVTIVWGVAVTFSTELDFSWEEFLPGLVENAAFSLQAILFKRAMVGRKGGWGVSETQRYRSWSAYSFGT